MRKRGASPVAVVALVVVIVACAGFVVYYLSRGGGPRVTGGPDIEKKYGCAVCGHTETMKTAEAAKLETGPAFDGGSEELHKCPECGKFAFDTFSKCPKCEKEYVDTGKGCPTCGKPKPKDE